MRFRTQWPILFGVGLAALTGCDGLQGMGTVSSIDGSTENPSGGGSGGSGGGATSTPGQIFFANVVTPVFRSQCLSCHNEPRFGGTAPLSIFLYNQMRARVTTGASAIRNGLMDKMTNIVAHGGGDRCSLFGLTGTPCKEVQEWALIENPAFSAGGVTGRLERVSGLGEISGWAADAGAPTTPIEVRFYLNGPSGTGTALPPVLADRIGNSGGFPGNHAFYVQLPDANRNGQMQTLYAYGVKGAQEFPLPGSPMAFAAYLPKAAGQQFFTQTVQPAVQAACARCHSFDYNLAYSLLLTPTPLAGGSALNNRIINKAAGSDGGIAHGGGAICASKSASSPCAQIAQWWAIEFN